MPTPTKEPLRQLADRVTSLEELCMHFERTVGELDGVVRGVQDRLDTLERRMETISAHLRGRVDSEGGDPPDDETV